MHIHTWTLTAHPVPQVPSLFLLLLDLLQLPEVSELAQLITQWLHLLLTEATASEPVGEEMISREISHWNHLGWDIVSELPGANIYQNITWHPCISTIHLFTFSIK